jgi:hypothetical protein
MTGSPDAVTIRFTPKYLTAFFCLAALLGIGHELAHHVAGYLICGAWGYKTFNFFELAPGCETAHPNTYWIATLVGPLLLNYLPMWLGVRAMRRPDNGSKLFGVSVVFAAIPIMRIGFNLVGANDESWIVHHFFGRARIPFWSMNLVIWMIAIPPLVVAWRTIQNRHRLAVFLGYLLALPVFVYFVVGVGLEGLIERRQLLPGSWLGMPYLVLLSEALAWIGYRATKDHLRRSTVQHDRPQSR